MKVIKIVLCLLTVIVVALNIVMIIQQKELDTVPPEITIDSDVLEVSVQADEQEFFSGVTAWDSRDGDLTGQLQVEHISQLIGENTAKITYAVFDDAGNAATASRTLVFTDYSGPRFQLSQSLNYQLGSTVTLLDRLTAVDEMDGDITGRIRITSQGLSVDVEGVYYLVVQVTNSMGDTQVLELPVVIQNITETTPEIVLSDYIVYLEVGAEFEPKTYLKKVIDPAGVGYRSKVEIQSNVDTEKEGVYEVIYSYQGEEDETRVIMTVIVTG